MALQQRAQRLGTVFAAIKPDAEICFIQPSGLVGPGHLMSVLARRQMHEFGTTREALFRDRAGFARGCADAAQGDPPQGADR